MKPGVAIPSLSNDGWITDPIRALDRLMAYFFESDKSQTYIYGDNIASLAYIYAMKMGDGEAMASSIASELETLLRRHYKNAEVECKATKNVDNDNFMELTLAVRVTDEDNNSYDLSKIIRGNKTKIVEIVDYLNG